MNKALEVLRAFARTSGGFVVYFEDGQAKKVRGRPRSEDHPFLLELAEEGIRDLGTSVRILHVGPTEVRVL